MALHVSPSGFGFSSSSAANFPTFTPCHSAWSITVSHHCLTLPSLLKTLHHPQAVRPFENGSPPVCCRLGSAAGRCAFVESALLWCLFCCSVSADISLGLPTSKAGQQSQQDTPQLLQAKDAA